MELLLNELSLSGQFTSIDDFVEHGVRNVLQIFAELLDEDQVLKKYNFYSSAVLPTQSIYDVLTGSVSRTCDELRKFKVYLSRLFDKPYWEDSLRHDADSKYLFGAISVSSTSLAEACERQRIIISFNHNSFRNTSIAVYKNGEYVVVDNLFEEGHYTTLLHTRGLLKKFSLKNRTLFTRTNLVRQGKPVYQEIATNYYWYLDNMHRNHFEVFNANKEHLGIADFEGNLDTSKYVNGRQL